MTDDVDGARDGQHHRRGGRPAIPPSGLQADDGAPSVDQSAETAGADADSASRPHHDDVPVLSWPVGAVADRLGVSTSTLRSWERRYGLGPTHRTGGNHRRYSPADLQRAQLMTRLTAAGIPAQAAAESVTAMSPAEVARRLDPGAHVGAPDSAGPPGARAARTRADGDDGGEADGGEADGGETGGGGEADGGIDSVFGPVRAAALAGGRATTNQGTVDAILSAASELDATGLLHLYRQTLRRLDFADAWSGIFAPSLRAIGERWGEGSLGIESEHLASELLQG